MTSNSPQVQKITIEDQELSEQRIDNFLVKRLKGVPKSRIYRAIRQGEIRVNKKRIKAGYVLQVGDQVRIAPIRVATSHHEPITYRLQAQMSPTVILETPGLLVINKPAGIAVHGGSGIKHGVIEVMRQVMPDAHYLELVHRIDRDTSGCLMIAKKRSVLRDLHRQFVANTIEKRYLLLVDGRCEFTHKTVDAPLLRYELSSGERMVKVSQAGKSARTTFRVLKRAENVTLLQAKPVTGRTHQIRVHAASLGHPIVGDEKYGDQITNQPRAGIATGRLYLHAASIQIKVAEETLAVCAVMDDDFKKSISKIRWL